MIVHREIAESRLPLILTGTVADRYVNTLAHVNFISLMVITYHLTPPTHRWLARKKFTTTFLSQQLPHVMAYRQVSVGVAKSTYSAHFATATITWSSCRRRREASSHFTTASRWSH